MELWSNMICQGYAEVTGLQSYLWHIYWNPFLFYQRTPQESTSASLFPALILKFSASILFCQAHCSFSFPPPPFLTFRKIFLFCCNLSCLYMVMKLCQSLESNYLPGRFFMNYAYSSLSFLSLPSSFFLNSSKS